MDDDNVQQRNKWEAKKEAVEYGQGDVHSVRVESEQLTKYITDDVIEISD